MKLALIAAAAALLASPAMAQSINAGSSSQGIGISQSGVTYAPTSIARGVNIASTSTAASISPAYGTCTDQAAVNGGVFLFNGGASIPLPNKRCHWREDSKVLFDAAKLTNDARYVRVAIRNLAEVDETSRKNLIAEGILVEPGTPEAIAVENGTWAQTYGAVQEAPAQKVRYANTKKRASAGGDFCSNPKTFNASLCGARR